MTSNGVVRRLQRRYVKQAEQEAQAIDPRHAAAFLIGRVHDADAARRERILAMRDLNPWVVGVEA
jgi:hypothetical protein